MNREYEAVIGLEVHVELKTKTKIFCACPTAFGAEPNTQCCPVCLGLPGSLPVLNAAVVEYAIKAGIVTNCNISEYSRHDRKNYFYPDLPKGYQISQYDHPLCRDGYIEIACDKGTKRIGIKQIHIEEDAGKLIHDREQGTLIDCNRCGVPLIEIVSEPDMRSADEAKAYLKKLRSLMLYADISDCKMNEGSLRCDVNISVRKIGEEGFGERSEVKNINSFNFVAKAIEYEINRQIEAISRGERIVRETRRFDDTTGKTYSMRSKENVNDYRYFPEPDLPYFEISNEMVERISKELPRLPDTRRSEYMSKYGLSEYDCEILTSDISLADYFEKAAENTAYPKILANLVISELLGVVSAEKFDPPISVENIAELASLVGNETINSSTSKKLLKRIINNGGSPAEIVKREGLEQINDRDILEKYVNKAVEENSKAVEDYKNGKKYAAKAIVGKVMADTQGRADPMLLSELLEEKLNT